MKNDKTLKEPLGKYNFSLNYEHKRTNSSSIDIMKFKQL